MYCSDFICTYLDYKCKDDDEYIQDQLYRSQFLQAFCLENWDDDIINKKTEDIYTNYIDKKCDNIFDIIFEKLKKSKKYSYFLIMFGDDRLTLFRMLFNFDLFYYTHRILCDIINNNNNKPEIIDLENVII